MMTGRSRPRKQVYFCGMIWKREAFPCCCVDFDGGRVVSLNDDVLTEILVRLPVKSVTRFKLVCKSWLSLISTHQFRHLHTLRRHKPPHSLFFASESYSRDRSITRELSYSNPIVKRSEKLRIIPFETSIVINNFKILSCSNGLMLLQCEEGYSNDYYVYNPTTKQTKKLSLAHNDKHAHVASIHLVFDPSKSPHHKIVCIRAEDGPLLQHQIEVFSSESETWRVCVESFRVSGEIVRFADCVQCKSLIFLIHSPNLFGGIYCFDIVKNVSQFIVCPVPQPAAAGAFAYSHSLQESNGCLYYAALVVDSGRNSVAAVWELQVNGDHPPRSNWLLKYRHIVHRLPDWLGVKLLTFITETTTMLIHVPGNIVAYSFVDKSYKEHLHLEPHIYSVNVHHFGETLALL